MVVIQLSLVAGFFHQTLSETLQDQISTKALIQAREIATDPNLIVLIQQNRLAEVQAKIDRLQRISDANFIVIGDANGIRIAHPDEQKIGLPMQGGDSRRALKEGEY
ncbi:ATPase, partial [Vibrio cholerae]|nr:ATPase [Vibrio cholerae]